MAGRYNLSATQNYDITNWENWHLARNVLVQEISLDSELYLTLEGVAPRGGVTAEG